MFIADTFRTIYSLVLRPYVSRFRGGGVKVSDVNKERIKLLSKNIISIITLIVAVTYGSEPYILMRDGVFCFLFVFHICVWQVIALCGYAVVLYICWKVRRYLFIVFSLVSLLVFFWLEWYCMASEFLSIVFWCLG